MFVCNCSNVIFLVHSPCQCCPFGNKSFAIKTRTGNNEMFMCRVKLTVQCTPQLRMYIYTYISFLFISIVVFELCYNYSSFYLSVFVTRNNVKGRDGTFRDETGYADQGVLQILHITLNSTIVHKSFLSTCSVLHL